MIVHLTNHAWSGIEQLGQARFGLWPHVKPCLALPSRHGQATPAQAILGQAGPGHARPGPAWPWVSKSRLAWPDQAKPGMARQGPSCGGSQDQTRTKDVQKEEEGVCTSWPQSKHRG